MPLRTTNLEWANHNALRRYPLADDADGQDQTGTFTLPTDFLVGLRVAVHAGNDVDPGRFFLKSLAAYAGGYAVVVGYQPVVGAAVPVANALVASHLHTPNKTYALGGVEPFLDATGHVTVGRLANIQAQPAGQFEFAFASTRLDPDAVSPVVRGVSSVTVVNAGQRSRRLYGDVELVAGANCQLVPIQVTGQNPKIRINAVKGEGTVEDCVCVGDAADSPPVKTINGIPPTADGNFTLLGDDCLVVQPGTNALRFSDTCSQPCCSCADLEAVTRDLERLQGESASVRQFADVLGTAVNTMSLVVLGSRLSDRSCQAEA